MTTRLLVALSLTAQLGTGLAGQSPEPRGTAFEVASVKPSASIEPGKLSVDLRQLVVQNLTLREIIVFTYGLRSYQLVGGPDWITTARFDIVAKAPEGVPRDARMIYTLLADRFKLRMHTESRQLPIYALILARADVQARRSTRTARHWLRPSKSNSD